MENIEQLIQQASDKDFANANNTFVDIMNQKLNDTLEQERIKVSGEVYNGYEPDELSDEEQLELDLETDIEIEDDESEEDDVDVDDDDDTDDSDEDTEES
jgi:hypothetical protein